MKKQIFFCFGLHLLLISLFSSPMESNQNQERQLVIFNQSQVFPVTQRQQNVTEPIISTINNPQADSSSSQINDFTTHNHQTVSIPETSALLSDEEAKRFIASTPSPKARIITNTIITRCFKTSPHKGSLKILFLGESGTGKTSLIKAVITTLKRPFAFIPATDVIDKDQYSSYQFVKNTVGPFLEKDSPCIIATDDIDRFKKPDATYLLSQYMDQANEKDKNRNNPHFIFLASANDLDDHSKRICSRSQIVKIGKPDYSSRLQILTNCIKDTSISYKHESIENLAQKTEFLSIKNLKELIDLSILLNDTKDIPYYYLSKTRIEQMLKELLPEKEISSVNDMKKDFQERWYNHFILEKLGNFIQFVGKIGIPIFIQYLLESTSGSNQETPETNQENSACSEDKTN